jgi:hypothetical protein
MAVQSERRSRRHVLTAAIAGIATAAAGTLARPTVTRAANGDNVVLGTDNHATSPTMVRNPDGNALRGASQIGIGLYGTSREGTGVSGFTRKGIGVDGFAEFGAGVQGSTDFGAGVVAIGNGGTALVVLGHARFSWSGVASIPAGETSAVFDIGHGEDPNVYAESFVLLSPKVNLGGRALWYRTDPAAGRFSIHISSPRSSPTEVGWLLLP